MPTLQISIVETTETPAAVQIVGFTNPATGADISSSVGLMLPAALTLSSGEWSISFTDIGLPLYAYTYTFTWSDTSTSEPIPGTKRGSTPAVGYYASQSDLAQAVTGANLAIWTGQDATGIPDVAMIQLALDNADAKVNKHFFASNYNVPLALGPVSRVICRDAATWFAVEWLYQSRGDVKDNDPMGNHYAGKVALYHSRLAYHASKSDSWDAARRWPTATAPVACY